MAKRKDILDKLYDILSNDDDFKVTYRGVAPAWGNVRQFPACAMIFDKEKSHLHDLACNTRREMNVLFIIYHKHTNNNYDDILSPLIDNLESNIKQDTELRDLVVISTTEEVTMDGGILHPYAMAELNIYVEYLAD